MKFDPDKYLAEFRRLQRAEREAWNLYSLHRTHENCRKHFEAVDEYRKFIDYIVDTYGETKLRKLASTQ